MAAQEPSREQLELAFRQLARPHLWPATLDQALARPHMALCLRKLAQQLGRPAWQAGQPRAVGTSAPVPHTPTAPPPRRPGSPAPNPRTALGHSGKPRGVDMKRAAANDRDE